MSDQKPAVVRRNEFAVTVTLAESFIDEIERAVSETVQKALVNGQVGGGPIRNVRDGTSRPLAYGLDRNERVDRDSSAANRVHFGQGSSLQDYPLMVDYPTLARAMKISTRSLYRLVERQAFPRPIALGDCKRFLVEELLAWMYSGCPHQQDWDRVRKQAVKEFRTNELPAKP